MVGLLTRWPAVRPTIGRLIRIPELPSACADNFNWPFSEKILTAHQAPAQTRLKALIINEDL